MPRFISKWPFIVKDKPTETEISFVAELPDAEESRAVAAEEIQRRIDHYIKIKWAVVVPNIFFHRSKGATGYCHIVWTELERNLPTTIREPVTQALIDKLKAKGYDAFEWNNFMAIRLDWSKPNVAIQEKTES